MEIKPPHADIASKQQRRVMRTLLLLTMISGFIFSLISIYRGMHLFAGIEFFMALISFLFYFKIQGRITFHLFKNLAFIYLLCFYIATISAVWFDYAVQSVIVWVMLSPLLCYFFLGRKLGSIFTVVSSITLIAVFSYHSILFYETPLDYFLFISNVVCCLIAIWFLIHAYAQSGIYHRNKLANMAMMDQLTNVYNRTALQACYDEYQKDSFSIIILDIDWFKKINDTYGHDVGDVALQFLCQQLQNEFEEIGYIIRLGGEEFAIIMPRVNINQADHLATSFLHKLRQSKVQADSGSFHMTFSAGVAQYPQEAKTLLDLQKLADRRLYHAKANGRNKVCRHYQTEGDETLNLSTF